MAPMEMLPAPGQGALAWQCRKDDERTRGMLRALHDPETAVCVGLERAVVLALNGDCHSPIAALATLHEPDAFMDVPHVHLRAAIGGFDGAAPTLNAEARAPLADAGRAVDEVMRSLDGQGVKGFLHPGA
jgi:hydroxymethylbilane synthase